MKRERAAAGILKYLCLTAGAACSGAPAQDMPAAVIDVHVHTAFANEPEPASGIPRTRERFLEELARAGVVAAVAHTDTLGGGRVDLEGSRVIHCGGVGAAPDTARLAAGLRSGEYRCLKIYLGYAHRYGDDPGYERVYALAAAHAVPVVLHTGDTSAPDARLKYSHPLVVDDIAVDHRDVTFVIAHAGYPWYETAAEIAYKNPNVVLEASAFMVGSPDSVTDEWLERYVVEPIEWIFGYVEDPSKLMFGSDWPLVEIAGYAEAYRRAIPREHWPAVFHDNAARVFGIEGTAR